MKANSEAFFDLLHDLSQEHLNLNQLKTLALIYDGPLIMSAIAAHLNLTSVGVTFIVDVLEGLGWLTRQSFPGDRRAKNITITDKGRELVSRCCAHISLPTSAAA